MAISTITHADDPRLEDFRDIRDLDVKGPAGRPGVFIGEQTLVVEKMLQQPERIRRILVADARRAWLESALAKAGGPEVEALVAPMAILESVAGFPIHRGVIASGVLLVATSESINTLVAARSRGSMPMKIGMGCCITTEWEVLI